MKSILPERKSSSPRGNNKTKCKNNNKSTRKRKLATPNIVKPQPTKQSSNNNSNNNFVHIYENDVAKLGNPNSQLGNLQNSSASSTSFQNFNYQHTFPNATSDDNTTAITPDFDENQYCATQNNTFSQNNTYFSYQTTPYQSISQQSGFDQPILQSSISQSIALPINHSFTYPQITDNSSYFKPVISNHHPNTEYGPNAAFSSSFSSQSPSPPKKFVPAVKTCKVPYPGADPNIHHPVAVPIVYQQVQTKNQTPQIQTVQNSNFSYHSTKIQVLPPVHAQVQIPQFHKSTCTSDKCSCIHLPVDQSKKLTGQPAHPDSSSTSASSESPTFSESLLSDSILKSPRSIRYSTHDPLIFSSSPALLSMLKLQLKYVPSKTTVPYFSNPCDTCDIRHWMRETVAQWMYDVCDELNREIDVFALATTQMDRFLNLEFKRFKREQLQLLGAACLLISSKLKETHPLVKSTLVKYSADTFSSDDLNDMEFLVLNVLSWDVHGLTAIDFLDHLLYRAEKLNLLKKSETRAEVLHVINHCYITPTFLRTAPSILCSASILYELSTQSSPKTKITETSPLEDITPNMTPSSEDINQEALEFLSGVTESSKECIKQAFLEVAATLKPKYENRDDDENLKNSDNLKENDGLKDSGTWNSEIEDKIGGVNHMSGRIGDEPGSLRPSPVEDDFVNVME